MTRVVSIRLKDEQVERLKRFARRMGKTQSEMGALLIEEGMREAEFAQIEFRHSAAGRQPYLKGSTLAVWEVIMVARDHDMDLEQVARYFQRPTEWVRAAFHYYEAFPAEIDEAIEDNGSLGYQKLKRLLPQLELMEVPRESRSDEHQP
jgi:uncharacterized protein (DUF433 family)